MRILQPPHRTLFLSMALMLGTTTQVWAYCAPGSPGSVCPAATPAVTATTTAVQSQVQSTATQAATSATAAATTTTPSTTSTGKVTGAIQVDYNLTFTGPTSGTTISLTASSNKAADLFIAVIFNGTVFFFDAAGSLTPYAAGKTPSVTTTLDAGESKQIDILKTPADLSTMKGAQFVVGYGQKNLLDPSKSFQDMLNNASYNVAYTVR